MEASITLALLAVAVIALVLYRRSQNSLCSKILWQIERLLRSSLTLPLENSVSLEAHERIRRDLFALTSICQEGDRVIRGRFGRSGFKELRECSFWLEQLIIKGRLNEQAHGEVMDFLALARTFGPLSSLRTKALTVGPVCSCKLYRQGDEQALLDRLAYCNFLSGRYHCPDTSANLSDEIDFVLLGRELCEVTSVDRFIDDAGNCLWQDFELYRFGTGTYLNLRQSSNGELRLTNQTQEMPWLAEAFADNQQVVLIPPALIENGRGRFERDGESFEATFATFCANNLYTTNLAFGERSYRFTEESLDPSELVVLRI